MMYWNTLSIESPSFPHHQNAMTPLPLWCPRMATFQTKEAFLNQLLQLNKRSPTLLGKIHWTPSTKENISLQSICSITVQKQICPQTHLHAYACNTNLLHQSSPCFESMTYLHNPFAQQGLVEGAKFSYPGASISYWRAHKIPIHKMEFNSSHCPLYKKLGYNLFILLVTKEGMINGDM